MTPLDLCTTSAKLLQALGTGETLSAEEGADAFSALNRLIDSWKLQPGTLTGVTKSVFPLVAGTAAYTIGASGGDFTQERPAQLQDANIAWYGDPSNPNEIPLQLIDADQYAALTIKTVQSSLPQALYYNATFSSTLGQITLWPVPNTATAKLAIYVAVPISLFTSLAQSITLLPGYEKAITTNLALEIAPLFSLPVPQIVQMQADESLTWVKASNIDVPLLRADEALVSRDGGWHGGSWLTGP
jgi:hypothetical protein